MYGSTIYGGDGNDKIVLGNDNISQYAYAEDGDDIIYGGDRFTGFQNLHGDTPVAISNGLELGGNDKIYGGSNATGETLI